MKTFVKNLFERFGLVINLKRNLGYLDSFKILNSLNKNKNPVIFDIGACDGSSIQDFKLSFPNSHIYSFEPFSASFKNAENIASCYSNVNVYQLALSNTNGQKDFFVNKSKATNSLFKPKITSSFIDDHAVLEECIEVPTITLDSFVKEHSIENIDILKLDVQGGELMVFEGAKETLQNKKINIVYTEVWLLEGYEGQPLYHDIAALLSTYGYHSFGIYNMHYRKNDGHFLWGDAIFYKMDDK